MNIELNNIQPLSFEFSKKKDSIWGADTTLNSPKIYKIIASSGSGKSTLISILSGLRSDYSGKISFDGRSISSFKPKDWSNFRQNKLSIVYQDLRLFPNLTARENIALSQEITEKEEKDSNLIIEKFAEDMQVKNQLNKLVMHLSFGQMQRIAIIRAIIRNYEWVILDEPFSHLDLNNATIAWQLITREAKLRNAGIIIACLDAYDFIQADKVFHL